MTSTRLYNDGFDNFDGFPNNKDVGIVVLGKPIDQISFRKRLMATEQLVNLNSHLTAASTSS